MKSRDWKWLAACALVVSACGAGGQADDDQSGDGSPYASDAGPPADDPTSDVAGAWLFSATRVGVAEPFLHCNVSVKDGVFDITCPQGNVPREIDPGCRQLRDDLHLNGSVVGVAIGQLDGMINMLVQYEGDHCASLGFTVGAAYPSPAFAQMHATRVEVMSLGDFLPHLGGRWDFTLENPRTPSASLSCEVHIGLELVEQPGVKVTIACPTGPAVDVVPGCSARPFTGVSAHVLPGRLDGDLAAETHHTGASCGTLYPPVVSEPQMTLLARTK